MKKITLTLFAALLLVSCGGKKKEVATVDELIIQSSEIIETPVEDEHSARNSLDYIGTYKGSLSHKDVTMSVTITLSDSTYSILGKTGDNKLKLENEGKYVWDEKGSTIFLEGVESPGQYWVVEGALIPLMEDKTEAGRLEKVE